MEYHRKNLRQGTYLDDKRGLTTVNILGVTGPDGRIYNVPGYAGGRRLSERQASERAQAEGWQKYPSYASGDESNAAARRLHALIEQDAELFRMAQKASPLPRRPIAPPNKSLIKGGS